MSALRRTWISMQGLPNGIFSPESYSDLRDRVETARSIPMASSDSEEMASPLSAPLVQMQIIIFVEEEDVVVPGCINSQMVLVMHALPESS